MGGHHHEVPEVPDWRIYKVEDVPQLMDLKKNLEALNLKNPWLRNQVWIYTEYSNHPCGEFRTLKRVCLKALKYALPAAILSTILEKTYLNYVAHEDSHH